MNNSIFQKIKWEKGMIVEVYKAPLRDSYPISSIDHSANIVFTPSGEHEVPICTPCIEKVFTPTGKTCIWAKGFEIKEEYSKVKIPVSKRLNEKFDYHIKKNQYFSAILNRIVLRMYRKIKK